MLLSYSQQYTLLPYCKGEGAEIGCAKKKCHPYSMGVDINPHSHAVIIAPGDKMPFKNDQLDYVVSSHCIEHIPDREGAIKEWVRVLKPNGVCAFITPDIENWGPQFYEDPTHVSPYTLDEVQAKFSPFFNITTLVRFEYVRARKNILFVGRKK